MKNILKPLVLLLLGFLVIFLAGKHLLAKDVFALVIMIYSLFSVIFVAIKICLKVRKVGGSMMTVTTGATDQFYNKDQKRAFEHILETKKHGKLEEQATPDNKDRKNE